MAKTIAGGVMISVGLLNFPVKVTTAVKSATAKGVSLSNACNSGHDATKINSVYRCPDCGNEDKTTFVKARVNKDKSLTVVDPESIKAAKAAAVPEALKNTVALTVHPAEAVDEFAVASGTPYQLAPEKGETAAGFYDLLATLVADRPDLAFVSVWASREKPVMYRLRSDGKNLRMEACAWPEDVEAPAEVNGTSSPEHRAMFGELLDSLVTEFDPAAYTDDRTRALADALEGGTVVAGVDATVTSMPAVDPLMAALEAARAAAA